MNDLRFPMFVSLDNKKVIIFGGGKVAFRRVNTLLLFHAHITVIAPKMSMEMEQLNISNQIEIIRDEYKEKYINTSTFMVIAATNDEKINEEIYNHCKSLGILVNNASNQEQCDFFFPAVVMEEDLVIGISGNGSNHSKVSGFAKKLRDILVNDSEIAKNLRDKLGNSSEIAKKLKEEISSRGENR